MREREVAPPPERYVHGHTERPRRTISSIGIVYQPKPFRTGEEIAPIIEAAIRAAAVVDDPQK